MGKEQLALTRPDIAQVSSDVVIREHGELLGYGAEGVVTRVEISSSRAPERSMTFASKEFHNGASELIPYKTLFENYQRVKQAKLPTYRTFRARGDEAGMIMTDLTKGGENVVLSFPDITARRVAQLYWERPDIMEPFARGEAMLSEATNTRTDALAEQAAEGGLHLYTDAWLVVVKPGGMYDFVVGDFRNIVQSDRIVGLDDQPIASARVRAMNRNKLRIAQERIGYAQQYLGNETAILQILALAEMSQEG